MKRAHVFKDRVGLLDERDKQTLFDLLIERRMDNAVAQVEEQSKISL
jgi:hypothetical protein